MRSAIIGSILWTIAMITHAQCVTSCGVERWDIKTGCDADAAAIDLSHAIDTTIADLRGLQPPADIRHFQGRLAGVEDQRFVLDATLTMFKPEADKDYHLVIRDHGKTMIAEIPRPSCVTSSSPFHDAIQGDARLFRSALRSREVEEEPPAARPRHRNRILRSSALNAADRSRAEQHRDPSRARNDFPRRRDEMRRGDSVEFCHVVVMSASYPIQALTDDLRGVEFSPWLHYTALIRR